MVSVIMPRQGQSVESCIITKWYKKEGDAVSKGDILFSYETDKASFDAEAEAPGIILRILHNEGSDVPVLSEVAFIGDAGEKIAEHSKPATAMAKPEEKHRSELSAIQPETSSLTAAEEFQKIKISPRARNMAMKMGIKPAQIRGSGPNGRVITRDIEAFSQNKAIVNLPEAPGYTDQPLSNLRKIVARTMFESLSNSAQLTHHMSADARRLLSLRAKFKSEAENGSEANITMNDLICFAVIKALIKHPAVNGHFLGDKIRGFSKVHLGMAVDTPRGLMVPALQNASDLSLPALSQKLRETAEICKKGNINPELLSGSAASFTVSNLGNYGVEMFTPIINPPQIAILGVNTIIHRPADLGDGVFGFIPVIGLSLTYDHRAIDGGPATLFLRQIKQEIETLNSEPLNS
jgi:pyruvate dehydrogenase E2 component (dihydrolipoamide acetyltransferase)